MKDFLILIVLLLSIPLCAQENQEFKGVLLKDVHHAPVNDVVVIEGRNEVYSADASGKILVHDYSSGAYISTFKKADNYPIHKLISLEDSKLTVAKKYLQFDNQPIDSLFTYNLDTGAETARSGIKGTFRGKRNENHLAAVINSGQENGMVVFQKRPFAQLGVSKTSKTIQDISFSSTDSIYVFTQDIGINYSNELVVRRFNGETLYQEELIKSRAEYKVFFESADSFLLFEYQDEKELLSIFRYQLKDFSRKLAFKTTIFATDWNFQVKENGDQWLLFPSMNNYETPVVYASLINGRYDIKEFQIDKPLSHLYLADQNLIRGFIHPTMGREEASSMIEFNVGSKRLKELGRSMAYGDNRAYFLQSGDYILQEYNSNYETNLRYYQASTFKNKYDRLKFNDWLKLKKGIDKYDRNFFKGQQEFQNNSVAFLGKLNNELRLIDYNLSEDTFSFLSPALTVRKSIVDYSSSNQLAIVVDRPFTVTEYPSLRVIEVCTKEACEPLKGIFLKAVLSENGELIATIDENFVFEIRQAKSKEIIYTEELVKEQVYEILSVDSTGFALSVQPPFEFNKCVKYTVFYEVDQDFKTTSQKNDCFQIKAFAIGNEKVALGIDSYGVFFMDQKIPIDQANPAVELSLNTDASLLFVSHAKGNISVYDTSTGKRKAQWILEDDERQLLVSDTGYYLANFDAGNLLTLTQKGINQMRDFLQPDEVLKTLGEIDQEYLTAIQKAEEFRNSSRNSEPDQKQFKIEEVSLNGGKELTTAQVQNTVSFALKGSPENIVVKHNGVALSDKQWQWKGEKLVLDFEVSDPINHIELWDATTNQRIARSTVNYTGPALEPNLHVLAIGVSQYKQSNNNLTFADKDALDIARFYGDIPKEDIQSYYDKFYAEPLSVHDKNGNRILQPINKYGFNIYGYDLKYLGADGRYWYHYDALEKKFYLFDFKQARVSEMTLPPIEKIETISFYNAFIPTRNGDAFYFLMDDKWNRYEIKDDTFEPISFPFDVDLRYQDNMIQLPEDQWMYVETSYTGSNNDVTITKYGHDDKQVLKGTIENDKGLTFMSVSDDGTHFLFKDYLDAFYLYKRQETDFQLISSTSNISFATLDTYFINVKDQTISRSNDSFDSSQRKVLWKKYDFDFQLKDELEVTIDGSVIINAIVDDGELLELRQKRSLANKDQVRLVDKDDAFAKAGTPASFKQTTVTYLLNEDATQEAIKKELDQLKSKVRVQDQVMVFFAGHGVLDEQLNYYYAPHDMDFNNVTGRGLSFDDIINYLGETKSTKMLLLMDTCHSGNTLDMEDYEITKANPNPNEGERGGIAKRVGKKENPIKVSDVVTTLFDNLNTVNGVTVLSASSGQDVAFEARDLSNGAFTTAFMQQVKSGLSGTMQLEPDYNSELTLSPEFINNLRVKVLQLTNNKQEMDIRERNELTTIRLW
ncbi:hypothetical protein AAU57_08400 [Nonlabens sp. YIK11]|uniref:caspase family protein n=1 Tax=Nonlabens sp. YIK11 TaxID=1453349 RepID=UPI0006DCA41F|nr:caspase family protein [Nonlabens sp. YIK11]KQC33331.1 hypothetical protein AAU57_08400 [Nonlabens sp. YIK11]